jgi:hypothetical protein
MSGDDELFTSRHRLWPRDNHIGWYGWTGGSISFATDSKISDHGTHGALPTQVLRKRFMLNLFIQEALLD